MEMKVQVFILTSFLVSCIGEGIFQAQEEALE
jgi:hypothetical protein